MSTMLPFLHASDSSILDPAHVQASLSVNSESHRAKIMGLLAQFNTILRIKQGAQATSDAPQEELPKVNSLAMGL